MKRFTDWIVVAGAVGASARASSPTRGSRPAGNETTEGTIARPLAWSTITRGVASSRNATRLFVVPRSMPTMGEGRSTPLQLLLDVAKQRPNVVQLRENPLGVRERVGVGTVADRETRAEAGLARDEIVAELVAHRGHRPELRVGRAALARRPQLLELLLHLEHQRRERRRHALVVAPERLAVQLEPVEPALHRVFQRFVGAVHERRHAEAHGLLGGRTVVEEIGVERARERVVAPLEVGEVDRETPRKREDAEVVRLRRRPGARCRSPQHTS